MNVRKSGTSFVISPSGVKQKITQYSNNDEYYQIWLWNKAMLQIVMKKINTRQCWKNVYFHQDAGYEKKKNQTGLTCWSFIQNIRALIHRLFVQWCAWPRHLVIVQFEKCCCWPIERGGDQTCRPILLKSKWHAVCCLTSYKNEFAYLSHTLIVLHVLMLLRFEIIKN